MYCIIQHFVLGAKMSRQDPDSDPAGSVGQDYGSASSDPEDIFTDPQHEAERATMQCKWKKIRCYSRLESNYQNPNGVQKKDC